MKYLVLMFMGGALFLPGYCAELPQSRTSEMEVMSNHGHCGKCGWALNSKGRCPNKNCHGYGPAPK